MINQNQHTYQDAKVYLCNFREDVISLLRSFRFAFFFSFVETKMAVVGLKD
jgi:hypothetical protein